MKLLKIAPQYVNVQHPLSIVLDYGILELNVRAAMVGYLFRHWNVDCNENANLRGYEVQIHVHNRQTIYDAENLSMAPGCQANE